MIQEAKATPAPSTLAAPARKAPCLPLSSRDPLLRDSDTRVQQLCKRAGTGNPRLREGRLCARWHWLKMALERGAEMASCPLWQRSHNCRPFCPSHDFLAPVLAKTAIWSATAAHTNFGVISTRIVKEINTSGFETCKEAGAGIEPR